VLVRSERGMSKETGTACSTPGLLQWPFLPKLEPSSLGEIHATPAAGFFDGQRRTLLGAGTRRKTRAT
jgi:hypothetical protein